MSGTDIAAILTAVGGIAPGIIALFHNSGDQEWTVTDIIAKVTEYNARENEYDKKFTTED